MLRLAMLAGRRRGRVETDLLAYQPWVGWPRLTCLRVKTRLSLTCFSLRSLCQNSLGEQGRRVFI